MRKALVLGIALSAMAANAAFAMRPEAPAAPVMACQSGCVCGDGVACSGTRCYCVPNVACYLYGPMDGNCNAYN